MQPTNSIIQYEKTFSELDHLRTISKLWEQEGFWKCDSVLKSLERNNVKLFYIPDASFKLWKSSILVYDCFDYYDILYVYTHPSFRKKHLATKLIDYIKNYIKENHSVSMYADCKNIPYIHLEVKTDNLAAISLYEKLGFKKVNFIKKYYSSGEDAYIYRYDYI